MRAYKRQTLNREIVDRSQLDYGCVPWPVSLLLFAIAIVSLSMGFWVVGSIFCIVLYAIGASTVHFLRKSRDSQQAIGFFREWAEEHKKFGILVTSESPMWMAHIESEWLPRIGDHIELLNWSTGKSNWSNNQIAIFNLFAGDWEYCPLLIVPYGDGSVAVYRFFQAFRSMKHGYAGPVRILEERMFAEYESWFAEVNPK